MFELRYNPDRRCKPTQTREKFQIVVLRRREDRSLFMSFACLLNPRSQNKALQISHSDATVNGVVRTWVVPPLMDLGPIA